MSIVRFAFRPDEIPADIDPRHIRPTQHRQAGYYGYDPIARQSVEMPGPCALYTWETHVGLCLEEREENGRDDSDFFMIVWNPETRSAERICFASTRGWSYPSLNSYVDATPEVRAAYAAAFAAGERRHRIQRKWDARRSDALTAAACGLPGYRAARRLRESLGGRPISWDQKGLILTWSRNFDRPEQATFIAVVKLLKTEKFKSDFKASLAAQIRRWVADPAPAHPTPLSAKQLQYV